MVCPAIRQKTWHIASGQGDRRWPVTARWRMTDGKLSLDDPASKYIKQWQNDPQKSKITIRQLGSHTAGLEDSSVTRGSPTPTSPAGRANSGSGSTAERSVHDLSRQDARAVRAREEIGLQQPRHRHADLCRPRRRFKTGRRRTSAPVAERVMRPIGVPDKEWSVGYGKTYRRRWPAAGRFLGRRQITPPARRPRRPADAPRWRLGRQTANQQRSRA